MTALKKKIFAVQRAPGWGYVGPPCGARWTAPSSVGKVYEKKGFLIARFRNRVSYPTMHCSRVPTAAPQVVLGTRNSHGPAEGGQHWPSRTQ